MLMAASVSAITIQKDPPKKEADKKTAANE